MQQCIQPIRRFATVRRALVGILTTLAGAAACDQQPDRLPTSPSIANRTVPRAAVVGADVTILPAGTLATDINDAGQVVGRFSTGPISHAFLWTPGVGMQDLGTLGGFHSDGWAINTAGHVVGSADLEGSRVSHAFLWASGKGMQDLGTLEGDTYSDALGIDDEDRVIGSSSSATGISRMFLWTPDRGMQDFAESFDIPPFRVSALNNAGQLAGTALVNGEYHAFLWTPGVGTRDLGTLDGEPTLANAMNEAGWVVGIATRSLPSARPFLWTPRDGMRSLGTLGAENYFNVATDVNDLGQVVGESYTAAFERHAFMWTETNGLEDLFPVTGMTSARALNNRGQLLGYDRVATLQFQAPDDAFATGSGFYDVPGQGKVKAHFSFTVKFAERQAVPNGKAKFWIPGGQLDFASTTVEALVVTGNRARFWGSGTLNGAAAEFRITAVDGNAAAGADRSADAFRIQLWRAGTLLFDTQPGAAPDAPVTTEIGGGSIQIHRE